MKKLILLLFIPLVSFGQTKFVYDHINPNDFDESGAFNLEVNYVDGLPQGEGIWYYPNGIILAKAYYLDGLLQGEVISYYESGEILVKRNYVNGEREGEWVSYYKSGEIQSKTNYVDSKRQGEEIWYYPSGAVKRKYKYVDGLIQGEVFYYYESGKILVKVMYIDDFRDGEEIYYSESGVIQSKKINYGNSKRQGVEIWDAPRGAFKSKINFLDDVISDEEEVPVTEQVQPPPPSPPPPPAPELIEIIEDEVEVEETIIESTESDEELEIEDIESEEFEDVEVPFSVIENVPIFPGCETGNNEKKRKCMSDKIVKFVQRNFNTDLAGDLGLSGRQRIRVIFKIDKSGNVVGIRARAPHPKLEKEAQRVINLLPKMKPGIQRGKAVIVPYSLPITFQVQD